MAQDALLGLGASIITELFKYVPFLNKTALSRALTAIAVLSVGVLITNGEWSWTSFANGLVFALTSYKAIVQPTASTIGLATQK